MLAAIIGWTVYGHYEETDFVRPDSELVGQWKGEGDIRMVNLGRYSVSLRHADDTRDYFGVEIDTAAHTLVLSTKDSKEEWSYVLSDPEHVRFIGFHAGRPIALALQRIESPLLTRGFHWVQEFPFNR